jgi:histidinol-phosphate aminotransferase
MAAPVHDALGRLEGTTLHRLLGVRPTGTGRDRAAPLPQDVVVVDEAYVAFGGESCVPLVKKYPQLLVTHTLSKSHALAGLRVGYATGHPQLIEALNRVKDSFNSYPLDRFAQAGATAAMEDEEYFAGICKKVAVTRATLVTDLQGLGFEVLPSAANFIFARFPGRDGADLAAKLRERSIIVRHFRNPARVSPYLRITVGTDEQCAGLVEALREIVMCFPFNLHLNYGP